MFLIFNYFHEGHWSLVLFFYVLFWYQCSVGLIQWAENDALLFNFKKKWLCRTSIYFFFFKCLENLPVMPCLLDFLYRGYLTTNTISVITTGLFRLNFNEWALAIHVIQAISSSCLSCKFTGINFFILFPCYVLNNCTIYSDVTSLIYDTGNLFFLSFFPCKSV